MERKGKGKREGTQRPGGDWLLRASRGLSRTQSRPPATFCQRSAWKEPISRRDRGNTSGCSVLGRMGTRPPIKLTNAARYQRSVIGHRRSSPALAHKQTPLCMVAKGTYLTLVVRSSYRGFDVLLLDTLTRIPGGGTRCIHSAQWPHHSTLFSVAHIRFSHAQNTHPTWEAVDRVAVRFASSNIPHCALSFPHSFTSADS